MWSSFALRGNWSCCHLLKWPIYHKFFVKWYTNKSALLIHSMLFLCKIAQTLTCLLVVVNGLLLSKETLWIQFQVFLLIKRWSCDLQTCWLYYQWCARDGCVLKAHCLSDNITASLFLFIILRPSMGKMWTSRNGPLVSIRDLCGHCLQNTGTKILVKLI